MNILAFVDLHGDRKKFEAFKRKAKDMDVILCAGDLTVFENNYDSLLKELDALGVYTLLVHGNHETAQSTHEATRGLKHVLFIHRKIVKYKDYHFLGWGGGGFSDVDEELEKKQPEFEKTLKGKPFIFLSHAPPYNTALDIISERHVGNRTIRRFIERTQPRIAVAGHLHENSRATARIGKTLCINPGPDGTILKLAENGGR